MNESLSDARSRRRIIVKSLPQLDALPALLVYPCGCRITAQPHQSENCRTAPWQPGANPDTS